MALRGRLKWSDAEQRMAEFHHRSWRSARYLWTAVYALVVLVSVILAIRIQTAYAIGMAVWAVVVAAVIGLKRRY